jgi:hypothetical protein
MDDERLKNPGGWDYFDELLARIRENRLLAFNDKPILQGSGQLRNERAKQLAHERYDTFDAQRRQAEALAADAEDLNALEAVAKKGKGNGGQ